MRKVQIINDTKGEVVAAMGIEPRKVTCPYGAWLCRPNCAHFSIERNKGVNGTVMCREQISIGELE